MYFNISIPRSSFSTLFSWLIVIVINIDMAIQEDEKKGGKKGRLLGIITLSDVLRYIIGETNLGDAADRFNKPMPAEEDRTPQPDTIEETS